MRTFFRIVISVLGISAGFDGRGVVPARDQHLTGQHHERAAAVGGLRSAGGHFRYRAAGFS